MAAPAFPAAATAAAIVRCGRCTVPSPPPPAPASTNNEHAIISVVRATVTARGPPPAGWAPASPPAGTIASSARAAIAECLMMGISLVAVSPFSGNQAFHLDHFQVLGGDPLQLPER